jgi:hypothetical protein
MPITKLTPERSKQMCDCARLSGTYDAACRAGGIDRTTLYRWLEKGKRGVEPYATFCQDFQTAYYQAEAQMLAVIKSAAMGKGAYEKNPTWQAAAWLLERSRNYNKSGSGGLPLKAPAPIKETPEQERYRIAVEIYEDGKAMGLAADRMVPVVTEYLSAKVALMEADGSVMNSREDLIAALNQLPKDLLQAALGEEE